MTATDPADTPSSPAPWQEVLARLGEGAPWTCASCGTEIADWAPFCPECGRPADDVLFERYGCLAPSVRLALATGSKTDPELLIALTRDNTVNTRIAYWASMNPSLPQDYVIYMAERGERWERILFIGSGHIPERIFRRIFAENDTLLNSALAKNPEVPADILAFLAADEHDAVRASAAANPSLTETLFEALMADDDYRVRASLAENPSATPPMLARLSKDDDVDVREAVAANAKAPAEVLLSLAEDLEETVRSNVCINPACPRAALEILAGDEDNWIADHAKKYLRGSHSFPVKPGTQLYDFINASKAEDNASEEEKEQL